MAGSKIVCRSHIIISAKIFNITIELIMVIMVNIDGSNCDQQRQLENYFFDYKVFYHVKCSLTLRCLTG